MHTRTASRSTLVTFANLVVLGALAAGCASAPARFYMLAPTATAGSGPAAAYAVIVGPVSLPAEVDRPEFVVQVAPNRVALDEFNRWAAPLGDGIARTVAGNLSVLLGTPHVATALIANSNPAYRITIDVQRFESVPGEGVLLQAMWAVRKAAGGEPRSGQTLAREVTPSPGFEALAAAHSRALATMSADIAVAIRAAAASKR
jgi:uncharacterized lipoprotein YmbA